MSREILSPEDWIKNVQGKSQIEHLLDCGSFNDVVQYMDWYAEYVERKIKESLKQKHGLDKI